MEIFFKFSLLLACLLQSLNSVHCKGGTRMDIFVHELGDDVTLNCTNGKPRPDNSQPIKWSIPDHTDIEINSSHPVFIFNSDPWAMSMKDIGYAHLGFYDCFVQEGESDNFTVFEMNLMLRMKDSWELYKDNLTVGIISASSCLICFGLIFLVYNNRWEVKETDDKAISTYSLNNNGALANYDDRATPGGATNPAYNSHLETGHHDHETKM